MQMIRHKAVTICFNFTKSLTMFYFVHYDCCYAMIREKWLFVVCANRDEVDIVRPFIIKRCETHWFALRNFRHDDLHNHK